MWEQSSRPRGSREPCAYRLLIGPVTLATIIAGLRPIADPSGVRRSFPAPWRVSRGVSGNRCVSSPGFSALIAQCGWGGDMDGRRVVKRLINGETALDIARSFGYRSPQPVMDTARDFIVAKLGAERYSALEPPLSGSCLCLGEDTGGCDVGTDGLAIGIALGCFRFWCAFAGSDLARVDVACQAEQSFDQAVGVGLVPGRPRLGRHGDEQALEAASDLQGQMIGGHLWWRLMRPLVRLLHAALQQSENIVGQHRDRKAQQRRTRVAKTGHLAVQHAFQPSEHTLDAPARAIQLSDPPSTDLLGQVAPYPDRGLAVLSGRIQHDLDAPPRGWLVLDRDHLLTQLAGLGAAAPLPVSLSNQARMTAVLTHDKAGSGVLPGLQHRAGAEMPVGDPEFSGTGVRQQRCNRG